MGVNITAVLAFQSVYPYIRDSDILLYNPIQKL